MFGALADDIDAPAGHSYNIAHKKRATVTITIAKTIANIASPKMVRLTATPSRSGHRLAAALSNLAGQSMCRSNCRQGSGGSTPWLGRQGFR
jgi:hypothetical protein